MVGLDGSRDGLELRRPLTYAFRPHEDIKMHQVWANVVKAAPYAATAILLAMLFLYLFSLQVYETYGF